MGSVKKAYLYLIYLVSTGIFLVGAIMIAHTIISLFIYSDDNYVQSANIAIGIAMMALSAPVFAVHWAYARRKSQTN